MPFTYTLIHIRSYGQWPSPHILLLIGPSYSFAYRPHTQFDTMGYKTRLQQTNLTKKTTMPIQMHIWVIYLILNGVCSWCNVGGKKAPISRGSALIKRLTLMIDTDQRWGSAIWFEITLYHPLHLYPQSENLGHRLKGLGSQLCIYKTHKMTHGLWQGQHPREITS